MKRPEGVPHMVVPAPLCSECYVVVTFDGDSYVCPRCGTSFDLNEDGPGTLYPDWSGEDYEDAPEPSDSGKE